MKHIIKDYFTFNQRERRGIFVLLIFQVLLVLFKFIQPRLTENETYDYNSFQQEIQEFEKIVQVAAMDKKVRNYAKYNKKNDHFEESRLFYFDPNHLPNEKWLQLGLTEKQLNTIRRFQNKGGRFYKKEDLKKIYVISEQLYSKLEPYIIIGGDTQTFKVTKEYKEARHYDIIELNAANQQALEQLPGIGVVLSGRIIKYRKMLGGFYDGKQLNEVFGIDSSLINKLAPFLSVDEHLINKLNINTATFKMLLNHPYMDYKMTKALVEFRNKNGIFHSLEDVKKINCIFDSVFTRIIPYFEI